jgi:uncharacterized protein (UPF0332 family)
MTTPPRALLDKATRALASAELLLDAADVDGACNRAYYAMFDAARAALAAAGVPEESQTRSHSGLISSFGLGLVKTGLLPVELGRAINRAAELRLIADYRAGPIGADDASRVVADAGRFLAAISAFVAARPTDPPDRG